MEETLLSDLVQYRTFKKSKSESSLSHRRVTKAIIPGVVIAARSLIQLFREINPMLLPKKERGRPGDAHDDEQELLEYGAHEVAEFVPGTEVT